MDAPEKEKLVLKKVYLVGLDDIIVREERLFEQTKRGVRYCGARFLHALNTSTALLNISFCLSGSKPKRCTQLASVLVDGAGSISFAALL